MTDVSRQFLGLFTTLWFVIARVTPAFFARTQSPFLANFGTADNSGVEQHNRHPSAVKRDAAQDPRRGYTNPACRRADSERAQRRLYS